MLKLSSIDAQVVDLFLETRAIGGQDGADAAANGAGQEALSCAREEIRSRLPHVSQLFDALNELAAPEPPASLAARVIVLAEGRQSVSPIPSMVQVPPMATMQFRPVL